MSQPMTGAGDVADKAAGRSAPVSSETLRKMVGSTEPAMGYRLLCRGEDQGVTMHDVASAALDARGVLFDLMVRVEIQMVLLGAKPDKPLRDALSAARALLHVEDQRGPLPPPTEPSRG